MERQTWICPIESARFELPPGVFPGFLVGVAWKTAASVARGAFDAFTSLLYPKRCASCDLYVDEDADGALCRTCEQNLKWLTPPYCRLCAFTSGAADGGLYRCVNCGDRRFAFDFAYAPLRGVGPIREMIHRLKYSRESWLARPLGQLLAKARSETRIARLADEAVLVPVPLHARRMRERGFNQAELLASQMSRRVGLPIWNVLERTRYTTTQTSLDREERMANLRGAFSLKRARRDLSGRTVWLIDDVLTTCSTADECARILKSAGAEIVVALAVARA
jgi:ComF family protein